MLIKFLLRVFLNKKTIAAIGMVFQTNYQNTNSQFNLVKSSLSLK